ncbi:MAG: hypothetical protein IRZ07_03490 [Microbispora sp.]|nr:hypothetical protein [Microbispora sp.]
MAIKRCKTSFSAIVNGAPRVINEGELVEDGDPILTGREAHFETVETFMSERPGAVRQPVEQATAEPGEKRTRRRAAKSAPKQTEPTESTQAPKEAE